MSSVDFFYTVGFKDFLLSVRQYRSRSRWATFAYYLDVWVLPVAGAAMVCLYLYGELKQNLSITDATDWLALLGLVAMIGLPSLYRLKLRKTYSQRIVLSESGKVHLSADESLIRFQVGDKVDVRYEWSAFSDYSEGQQVLTLFVKTSALHTIPLYQISTAESDAFRALVDRHVRRYRNAD